MPRIQLLLYLDPGYAEVFIKVKLVDGSYRRLAATIDTGAETSLLPKSLLPDLEHKILQTSVAVQQAGIAQQEFLVDVVRISMILEDQNGVQSDELQVPVWFAHTDETLIGFDGILDSATLFIDMRQTRTGWIEIEP